MSLRDDYKALRDNPAWKHLIVAVEEETARGMHALAYDDPARIGHSHVMTLLDLLRKRVGHMAAGKDKVTLMHQQRIEAAR